VSYQTIFTPFHHKTTKRLRAFFVGAGLILWVGASIAAIIPMAPHVLYRLSPKTPDILAKTIADTVPNPTITPPVTKPTLPDLDSTLSKENSLKITKIGVNGLIHEGENWEEILKTGIWRDPDLFTPETGRPVILAAHRWGYLAWTNNFRRLNSFFNLPKLKSGDNIEIIWNQRRYTYQVDEIFEGEIITDFDTDLILYTCQLWNSPVRVFVHAHRIN
jgi:hypothetical protein